MRAMDANRKKKSVCGYDTAENTIEKDKHIKSRLQWGDPDLVPEPWISYVVPTYRRPDLLREALISILNQDEVDFRWQIVVSDNDTDGNSGAEQVVRELNDPKIIYYRHDESLSGYGNWNRSIQLARSPWVAMLHDDDMLMHDHLVTMADYIKRYEKKSSKPLAYISSQYIEISNRKDVDINADNPNYRFYDGMSTTEKSRIYKYDILQPYTKRDSIITGASVYMPSNGTIMNRDIMIKTGGFKRVTCSDVIKPFTLIGDYRVYKTLRPMGYYCFGRNETVKPGVPHRIAKACMEISDYIYQSSLAGRIWGNIAYDERFSTVVDYMMRYASYGNLDVKREDFDDIHMCRKEADRKWRRFIYQRVLYKYSRKMNDINLDEIYTTFFEDHMNATCKVLDRKISADQNLYLYGAGVYGKKALSYLLNKGYTVSGFAVTSGAENCEPIEGYSVYNIADIVNMDNPFFLITTLPDKQFQIIATLRNYGTENYAYLI